jgi:rare lipoprotein A (peptidoglycan hydrolase)
MRIDCNKTTTLLALITVIACAIAPAGSALASTGGASGGASAPSSSTPATSSTPAQASVHTTGIATWFGPGFYGQKTACGQTLTPGVVGVANRTLPCGTLVQVSYKGRALTVPVVDRGPYSNIGADWDLTAGAAEALGIEDTVRIGTRVVGNAPNTPTLGAPPPSLAESATGGAAAS